MGNYRKWSAVDFVIWKVLPVPGNRSNLRKFKDAWIVHNKLVIKKVAMNYSIPADVLGAVAWIEVGGAPDIVDYLAFAGRAVLWSGPEKTDKFMAYMSKYKRITSHPLQTSFGSVSIQLGNTAKTIGLDVEELDAMDIFYMLILLNSDVGNLNIVAKHLRDLALFDNPGMQNSSLFYSDDVIRILGARYNRGTSWSLEELKKDLSYGNSILRFRPLVRELLK